MLNLVEGKWWTLLRRSAGAGGALSAFPRRVSQSGADARERRGAPGSAAERREYIIYSGPVSHAPPAASHRSPRSAASPLCRTTRPLGASRGPRARPARLLLLAAWLAAAAAQEPACPREPLVCATCRSYENAREHSLRVIRESLLAKLGFTQAPNTTGRELPRVPADLMERYERRPPPPGVQADAPAPSRAFVTHTEQDDFLARTDNVLIFAHHKGRLRISQAPYEAHPQILNRIAYVYKAFVQNRGAAGPA
ncbi:unnamed protein product, partial [Iphiclides podalirius]